MCSCVIWHGAWGLGGLCKCLVKIQGTRQILPALSTMAWEMVAYPVSGCTPHTTIDQAGATLDLEY